MHAQKRTIADKLCIIQELEEKLAAKTKAHEKGCKTIQHLLIKIRDLDDEISRLKVEVSVLFSFSSKTAKQIDFVHIYTYTSTKIYLYYLDQT